MMPQATNAAALAAVGLGFELEPGLDGDLDADEVLALRDAAALLAFAPAPIAPPAAEWRRLTGALAASPRARHRVPIAGVLVAGAGLVAAAAAIVVAIGAVDDRNGWRRSARAAERDVVLAGEELRAARVQLSALDARARVADDALATMRAPELQVASFHGEQRGRARVLLDPGGRRWIVVAFELPALDGKDYQLWLVPDGGAPISAGVLARRADGVLELSGAVPASIAGARPAISLEPRGGSPSPTTIEMVGEPL